jgi:2-C-methyl-D-erythritol 4-phosphate cytidylyltransferase
MFTLILLSGGAGTRMKYAVPKQYMLLAGKPVIMHILERLDSIQAISDIVVVCTPEYEGTITEMVSQYGIRKPIRYAPAGRTRQESVLSGLSLVTSPDVIIHEAARPFVKVEDFEEIINCTERNATFGLDIPFTVLRGQDHVEGVLTRSELFNVQLPQKFETSGLKEAHDKARKMIRDADLLIIGGTSLQVGSAAGLARQFDGGRLVIVNKSRTLRDGEADLVFHDSIGKVLSTINSMQ